MAPKKERWFNQPRINHPTIIPNNTKPHHPCVFCSLPKKKNKAGWWLNPQPF